MIDVGSLGITDMRIGTSQVLAAYVGTDLVYPSYTFYDYVAPTGTTYLNNYIKINKQCTTGFSAEAKFRMLANTSSIFLGFWHSSDANDYRLFYTGTLLYFDYGVNRKSTRPVQSLLNIDFNWTIYNYGVYDNGTQSYVLTGDTQTTAPDLTQYNINVGSGRFYGVKMYESDVLQNDLVPAVRNSDGVAGLYDTIGGGFYTAQDPTAIGAYNNV